MVTSRRRWQNITPRAIVVAAMAVMAMALTSCTLDTYVSLGDSYTAGPVIPVQQNDPTGCLRSDHNYPHLVALDIKATLPVFRDVSCSGATTDDMTAPQDVTPGPANPPQFDGLDSNTKAVSLTIGGNDIGFTSIAEDCFSKTGNNGTPCQDKYVVNGNDEVSNRIGEMAPKVAAVLRGIHTRSPQAKIFLLGYLAILPDTGPGCYPQMPVTDGDVPYLRAKEKQLNDTLKFVTVATGNIYVDAYAASIGRDSCQLPTVRWVEPLIPVNPAAPIHPNSAGMQGYADVLRRAMAANGF